MEINGLLPQGFEKHFKIDNTKERFEEAEKVGKRLLDGGIALKNNADHYAIFTDPPRLLAVVRRRDRDELCHHNAGRPSSCAHQQQGLSQRCRSAGVLGSAQGAEPQEPARRASSVVVYE